MTEHTYVVPRWFAQQRTWLEDPINSDSSAYNYPLLLHIRGPLSLAALQQSLQEIVRRHEVLRSPFEIRNGELVQVVVPPPIQRLPVIDLCDFPAAERNSRADQIILKEANLPFDLTSPSLLRSLVIKLAPDHHLLQITAQQIFFDDWSSSVLLRELSELYPAFTAGKPSPLANLTFRYGDFVRWQAKRLEREEIASKLRYWKQQLSGDSGFQHVPPDFPQPLRPTRRAARESVVVPVEVANSLKAVSRQERVSLFMVLLTAFKCVVSRYSGDDDIGIGSCVANRALAEVEGLIGRFANPILLRTSLAGDPSLRDLLMRVRETALTAYSQQDVPFGMVVKHALGEANPNRSFPFEVMFILQNALPEPPGFGDLTVDWSIVFMGTATCDLHVWLKTEPQLEVTIEYKTELFHRATITHLLEHYRTTLAAMSENSGMRISDLAFANKRQSASAVPIVAQPLLRQSESNAVKTELESSLVELWEAAFKLKPIGVDDDFFELGGESLLGARLFAQIEKSFQISLPLATLLEAPTIRRLAAVIAGGGYTRSSEPVLVVQPNGTKPPLFCVFGHDDGVLFFGSLARWLGADQPLYGLKLESFGTEQSSHTIEAMAGYYLREIEKVQPAGPYCLSGYCFGGMVAYEIARVLKTRGEEVALLVLFNVPPPGSLKGWPFSSLRKRITYEVQKLRALETRKQLAVLRNKTAGLRRMLLGSLTRALWQTLPQSPNAGGTKTGSRLHNFNVIAAKTYCPPSYAGRITLFVTEEIGSRYAVDPITGWEVLAADGTEVHRVAGENASFFAAENIEGLAEKLQSCLSRAHCENRVVSASDVMTVSQTRDEVPIGKT